MSSKRRRSSKHSNHSGAPAAENRNAQAAETIAQPTVAQPVTVAIPEPPPPPPPALSATRYMPVEEPPPPPALEKPIVIRRSASVAGGRSREAEIDRIGDILRRVREHRGETLEDISDYLRIRAGFLAALEASRYEELPADAYVIGFLRTYANYLGLDGRAVIDQYRKEMAGRRRKPQLSMPQPVSEGPAPTIAILVSAALAALLVYVLWYAFVSSDRAEVSVPPPLPQTVAEAPASNDKPADGASAPVVLGDASAQAQPASQAAPQPTAQQPAATQAAPQEQAQKPQDAAAAQTQPQTPQAAPPAGIKLDAKPPAETAKPPEKQAQDDNAAKDDKTTKESTAKETPAKDDDKTEETPKGKVFGTAPSRARIVIKAVEESWILIADAHGNTVFDHTMKPGDTYYVPTTKGLTLTTGNGKGLRMSLDGSDLPGLGAEGAVVREVPLDPEKMKGKPEPTD
jgi:cytoskeletal protein RodZ